MRSDQPFDRAPLTLRDYLSVLWRRWWIVLGVTAIACGVGVFRSERQTPIYQAQGQLELANIGSSNAGADLDTQIGVVASPAVHAAAERQAPGVGQVSAQQAGLGNIISVSATSADAAQAARTVNATMQAYVSYVQTQAEGQTVLAAAAIQSRIDQLQKQVDALSAFSARAPRPARSAIAQRRRVLIGEQASLQQSLDGLQLALANASASTGISVLAAATVPTSPIRPKPRTDGLIALGGGMLLGLVLAFLLEYLAPRKRSGAKGDRLPDRVAADPRFLGVIPVGSSSANEVVSLSAPDSAAALPYRSVQNAASLIRLEDASCLEITSATDRDGKTETVTNLAVLLARAGRLVVVVDCDLRKPRVHDFFGLPNETGFTSVIRGVPLTDALQRVQKVDNLHVLTSGPLPADPNEMLASDRCGEIFRSLLAVGALVIIDTPPMLPFSEAHTVAKTAPIDAVMLVATARTNGGEYLREALDSLYTSGAPQIGVVLTTRNGASEQPAELAHRFVRRHNRSNPADESEGSVASEVTNMANLHSEYWLRRPS